jgi:hypothetical protein
MSRRSLVALLMISLMLISIPSSATAKSDDDDLTDNSINYTNKEIKMELNETAGELRLNLGNANMRLFWGTADDPGEISLLTRQVHFMGVADIHNSRGSFDKRVGIPVNTVFYQKNRWYS